MLFVRPIQNLISTVIYATCRAQGNLSFWCHPFIGLHVLATGTFVVKERVQICCDLFPVHITEMTSGMSDAEIDFKQVVNHPSVLDKGDVTLSCGGQETSNTRMLRKKMCVPFVKGPVFSDCLSAVRSATQVPPDLCLRVKCRSCAYLHVVRTT